MKPFSIFLALALASSAIALPQAFLPVVFQSDICQAKCAEFCGNSVRIIPSVLDEKVLHGKGFLGRRSVDQRMVVVKRRFNVLVMMAGAGARSRRYRMNSAFGKVGTPGWLRHE
ncbi:hypothetical protein HYALB_00009132 [Hymenoscyphus albidus]|uniref:Uncharacterized protein n=1 Tax=Hymenoscyphus albidus TaxID=595503 RepID=A0A9N9LHT7_9HELO|nr:hypothetical protein HYALB_00009132 [Hymenoscyphus albidus]